MISLHKLISGITRQIHQRTHKKELHQIPLYIIILPAPRFSSQDTELCSRSRPFFTPSCLGIEEKLNYELLESARCTFPKKTASIPSCSTPSSANDSRASSYQSPACEDACDRGEGDEPQMIRWNPKASKAGPTRGDRSAFIKKMSFRYGVNNTYCTS